MSALYIFTVTLLVSLLNTPLTFSADSNSPGPAPQLGADVPSPSQPTVPSPSASPEPSVHSPPAPSPYLAPGSSPAPAPSPETSSNATKESPAPTPAPDASDIGHEDAAVEESNNDGGLSGGQKAGIAIGVIAGVFIVGAGTVVYRKRQSNIQRSQFGYDARREIL